MALTTLRRTVITNGMHICLSPHSEHLVYRFRDLRTAKKRIARIMWVLCLRIWKNLCRNRWRNEAEPACLDFACLPTQTLELKPNSVMKLGHVVPLDPIFFPSFKSCIPITAAMTTGSGNPNVWTFESSTSLSTADSQIRGQGFLTPRGCARVFVLPGSRDVSVGQRLSAGNVPLRLTWLQTNLRQHRWWEYRRRQNGERAGGYGKLRWDPVCEIVIWSIR